MASTTIDMRLPAGTTSAATTYSNTTVVEGRKPTLFAQALDAVNPLQHVPGVSQAYRAVTGDKISETSKIVGTDLMFGLAIAALGGSVHLATGNLNQHLLLALSSGGVFGALCGAWLGTKVPARALRVALSTVMVLLGQQLLWKGLEAMSR